MGIKDNIEDLFSSEDIDSTKASESTQTTEADGLAKIESPDERREFTRINLSGAQIGVQFDSKMQFAKHYLENISLGGIFVRTTEKRAFGEIIPINFSIPREGEDPILFQLYGKVCRITKDGVGLEFTNLNEKTRADLERYVRSILPSGTQLRAKPKQSSVDRLEKMRAQKEFKQAEKKKLLKQIGIIVCLVAVNTVMARFALQTVLEDRTINTFEMKLGDETIKPENIKSIETSDDGKVVLHLDSSQELYISENEIQNLPLNIRHSIELVQNTPKAKAKRKSKNNNHSRIRLK